MTEDRSKDVEQMLKDENVDLLVRRAQKALMDLYDEGNSVKVSLEPHGLKDLTTLHDWSATVAVPSILDLWEVQGGTRFGLGGHCACLAIGMALGAAIADGKVELPS